MKSKITLLVSAFLFIVLIAGAGVLYDRLGEGNNSGGLVVDMPTTESSTESDTFADESTNSPDVTENISSEADAKPAETTNEAQTTSPKEDEEPENPAPDFTVVDANGKTVNLSDLRGKPVVLNFWASWCIYCVKEMPDFEEAYNAYGDEIHFVMLNTLSDGETKATANSLISNAGYNFPVYFDESGIASYIYGASQGIPRTYFIDAKGNLVAHAPGMLDADILKQGIDMIK